MDAWWVYPLVFVAAMASSWLGALVGGGSLIVTSVLLALGMPGTMMVGSRRFAAIGGNVGSWLPYHKAKKVDYRLALILFPLSVGGLFLGWYLLEFFKDKGLENIIAIILFGLLVFKFLKDQLGSGKSLSSTPWIQHLVGGTGAILSGTINNLTGAGGGMVLVFGILLGYGKSLLGTAGTAKFVLMLSNSVAAIMFSLAGYISWELVFVMMAGHFVGGWLGARFFLKREESFLRWVFYAIVLVLIIKTLFG